MFLPAASPSWCYHRSQLHPFKIIFSQGGFRMIATAGIAHNSEWLHWLKAHDQVLATLPWHYTHERFQKEMQFLLQHNHIISNWWILCNTKQQQLDAQLAGFQAFYVNNNCWLDEKIIPLPESKEKQFKAIYTARPDPYKRHSLCAKVNNLALIAWGAHANNHIENLSASWNSMSFLDKDKVYSMISKAYCGLALSAVEGAMFASSEYLLCGVPVVSTPSEGGRDVFYDSENSIICAPTPESVSEAVEHIYNGFKNGRYDPQTIRNKHIELANGFRMTFSLMLKEIFDRWEIQQDASNFLALNFRHKMLCNFVKLNKIKQQLVC